MQDYVVIVTLLNGIFLLKYTCSNRFEKLVWVSIELPVICHSQPEQASLIYGDILDIYCLETRKKSDSKY